MYFNNTSTLLNLWEVINYTEVTNEQIIKHTFLRGEGLAVEYSIYSEIACTRSMSNDKKLDTRFDLYTSTLNRHAGEQIDVLQVDFVISS